MKTNALYIHIPFCNHICSYCDFCKIYYREDLANAYIEALQKELHTLSITDPLYTLYIGGGTPSSLNYQQLQMVMTMIQPYITKETIEVSIEVNPESMDKKKLEILKKGKVNRISIGVQTFDPQLVANINRKHSLSQVVSLVREAYAMGFIVSLDMMYGLEHQTLTTIKKDLQILSTLSLHHISYYSLIIEKHTRLYQQKYQGIQEDLEFEMLQTIDQSLESMGYKQYEVSNYAKAGYQSKHNTAYWKYNNYFGIGVGATSKIDHQMHTHNRNIYDYIKGKQTITTENMRLEDSLFNTIMMSLRLLEGIDITTINERYQIDFEKKYAAVIQKHIANGSLHKTNGYLHCNKQSLWIMNTILLDFFSTDVRYEEIPKGNSKDAPILER